jgi:hypothetical protein
MKRRAYFVSEIARPRRIHVGDGDETDRGVGAGEPRAQRADAPRAHDGDSEIPAVVHPSSGCRHGTPPDLAASGAGRARYGTNSYAPISMALRVGRGSRLVGCTY